MSEFLFSSTLQCGPHGVNATIAGGTAVLRPLEYGEAEPLQLVFDGLSPDSRTARFLSPRTSLTATMRRSLAAVDGHDHVAWVASVDGRPAGIARAIRVGPQTAELAFEVVDEHQGRGLGAVLLDTITTVAVTSGIRRLQAYVLGSNRVSQHLLTLVGVRLRRGDGVLEADAPFHLMATPRVNRPAVVRIALAGTAEHPGALPSALGPAS
jgi:RimJ/RimL family protein N-acetyltransferase